MYDSMGGANSDRLNRAQLNSPRLATVLTDADVDGVERSAVTARWRWEAGWRVGVGGCGLHYERPADRRDGGLAVLYRTPMWSIYFFGDLSLLFARAPNSFFLYSSSPPPSPHSNLSSSVCTYDRHAVRSFFCSLTYPLHAERCVCMSHLRAAVAEQPASEQASPSRIPYHDDTYWRYQQRGALVSSLTPLTPLPG